MKTGIPRERKGRRRADRRLVAAVTAGLMLLGSAALADNIKVDGDSILAGFDLNFTTAGSGNSQPCDVRGSAVGGAAEISRTGASPNLIAGEQVVLSLTSPHAGITVSGPNGAVVPDPWGGGGRFEISYTTTVSAAVPDGTYEIEVEAVGGTSGATLTDSFDVNISCATSTNTAPTVEFTGGPTSVDESGTTEHTFSFSITDPDVDDSWTFVDGYPSCGSEGQLVADSAEIAAATKAGSFDCIFDDGLDPAEISEVAVKVKDAAGAESNEATRLVTVNNVAPTASLTRMGPANVFTGTTVTYNASATDPSYADTDAGFAYSFGDGAFTEVSTLQATYTSCGVETESVRAADKDDGISDAATASVTVHDGGFHGAIKPATRNMVQKGRVVPVQIRVSCDGVDLTGLTPAIQLLRGEFDPETEPDSDAVLVPTSVSGADSTGVMRPTDAGYIYNLQIPKDASAGQQYTVRVRPWGSDGAALNAVLEIRR